ncbi:hypothetical protein Ahy_B06g083251 [Arachis hypogaea]|uniref:Protein FAR1-RELATED SEQUENCE n=1 Tax=Arachis hypogaea TaxID=3818 RepID=A0A444YPR4_ARAHY|nr:hypothetical protein Ahy_B06g083251 [Arachis hypogaea]
MKKPKLDQAKIYQSFIAVAGGHRELSFIEKDVRNYIMRGVRNNFFSELELEVDQLIKIAFWVDARCKAACEYFRDIISFDATYNTNRNWNDFLMKYGLGDNKWLSGSREQREGERERESDAADFNIVIPCARKSSIEAQFQHLYTHKKFRKVQAQFREKVNCITRSTHFALGYTVYEVIEQLHTTGYQLKLNASAYYSSQEGYCVSKNINGRHTHFKSRHDEPLLEPSSKRFDDLVFQSEELTAFLHRAYDNAMVEMQEYKVKSKEKCSLSHEDAFLEDINDLQSPPRMRTRGHYKCFKEKENKSSKRGKSDLNIFYGGSVVQSNSSQYHRHAMNYQFKNSVA